LDQNLVVQLNQAAINGIRSVGATSQYIFVEGNAWTGAWTWVDINDSMKSLTDPEDKIIFEMHQYFNDNGGNSITCMSPTIGAERVVSATKWLRTNGKLGVIGEFAGYDNDICRAAVAGMIDYLSQNADVWTGALWWSAGPWWGNAEYSYEPPSGHAYQVYKPILQPYFPTSTTSTISTTSTASLITTGSTASTTLTPTPTPSQALAQRWSQCGGQNWTGPTVCVSPYTCHQQNPWYSQCL
jgi:endoglucanase